MYFHATFISNVRGIMERGLLKGAKRIWDISGTNYIYLSDEPDDAVDWMIYWYDYKLYEAAMLDDDGFLVERPTNEELLEILQTIPMINDGVVVFAVDTAGMNVKPTYYISEDKPADYVVRKNIPPNRLKIVGYIYPEDIQERIKKHWEIQ